MGRPIKFTYFGTPKTTGTGGEGVASFVVITKGSNFSQGANITVAASPIGGTTAVGALTVNSGNGAIVATTVLNAGSGYTTAPAVTITKPTNVAVVATTYYGNAASNTLGVTSTTGLFVGMVANSSILGSGTISIATIDSANSNVTLSSGIVSAINNTPLLWFDRGSGGAIVTANLSATTTTANSIQANVFLTGGTTGSQADIVVQKGSRRYRVNSGGTVETVRLVAATADVNLAGPSTAGTMTITATDSAGGTYLVQKLESRTASLIRVTGTQFANNEHVSWNLTGAVLNTSVKLATND